MGNSKKTFTIFAGVNGAGKSTLYHTLGQDFGVRLNFDEMVQRDGATETNSKDQLKVVKDLLEKQQECIDNNLSFNRETTVPGNKLLETIKLLKKKKYTIQLLYVGVESVDICKERVAKRVSMGGHDVPEDLIESRYLIINKVLPKFFDYCDIVQLFDNSFDSIQMVGYKDKDKNLVKLVDNCHWLNDICNEYNKEHFVWFEFD